MKKLNQTISYVVIAIILIGLATILSLTGCSSPVEPGTNDSETRIIKITNSGSFTEQECQERGFEDKVIMFESKYCGHCQKTLPIFNEACEEKGMVPEILDLSIAENLEKSSSYNLEIMYTPTFVIGCHYYVGVVSKEEYLNYLDKI